MSLELIQQQAKTIRDMYEVYQTLLQRTDSESEKKKLSTKKYMRSLTKNIQKMIDEERQNVS